MKAIKNTLKALNVLIFLVLFTSPAMSYAKEATKTPDFIKGTTIIDAEGLIKHVEQKPDLIIIDSRISSDRQQGFIEGSVNLPDSKTSCATLSKILSRKDSPVIFYCNGPKCGRSAVAVKIAIVCGYKNTYWYRAGFEEWKQKKYPFITTRH